MNKALIIGVTVLSFGLAGCTSNSSTSSKGSSTSSTATTKLTHKQMVDIYNSTANAEANVWNKFTNSIKANDTKMMSGSADDANVIYTKNLATLSNHKGEKYVADLTTFVKDSQTVANDYLATATLNSDMQKAVTKGANSSIKVRKELNISSPQKLNDAINSASTAIKQLPGVTGKTIQTTDYTITITSTETTPHFEGGTDLIVYYTFKNTSKDKNIEPETSLFEATKFTQESKTSINDLDSGNPDKDSDEWSDLLSASQQKVKPGAEIRCMESYKLNNTDYPVKVKAVDPDNDDAKLGTITLELPNN